MEDFDLKKKTEKKNSLFKIIILIFILLLRKTIQTIQCMRI
jgi:hypothetical protein